MSAATAFAIAAAFNLVCTGDQITFTTGDKGSNKADTFHVIYRVDLESRRWCSDQCKETQPLFSVSETQIVFSHHDNPPNSYSDVSVNRESGAIVSALQFGKFNSMRVGSCAAAPFTGFPTRKF